MLNRLHLLILLRIDVHDVVEDHEVAEVVEEVEDAQDDAGDHKDQDGSHDRLCEDKEDLENKLN